MKNHIDKINYHILVIEDNIGDFTLIQDYLEERLMSPKIAWTKSFKEAKEYLINSERKSDIVLLDLTLPDKSGEALINDIIPLCSDIPLIILTGYSDILFGIKSLSLGASDYLIKDELDPASLYKSILYNIERKKSQIQLEISEKRYSDLFHLSPIPMWVYDTETMRFLDVNMAAEKHYGYSLQEFLGMTIGDIRPKEDIPLMLERVQILNENKPTFFSGTYRHKKKNGDIIHVDIQSNTLPFQNTIGRIILANDVTERFAYIEAIEKQNEKLKEIAWIQSHVVRAPLAKIVGLIDLIKNEGFNAGSDNEKLFGYLLNSAAELDTIIRDISNKAEEIKLQIEHKKPLQ
ncbi:PAS domain S-box protein [Flavobacterium sp.]|uniref:PAS domain-containing response regulator n=1 Tax=Flavobacterium sp. TaxID=239 RepID=UPI0024876136|nr:PAS domain S-box protein [Flavobacterium sp.]MDI1315950.1 PAS domain S-box protein [Flavobacterium sp.]